MVESRDLAMVAIAKEVGRFLEGSTILWCGIDRFEVVWRGALARARPLCRSGWSLNEPNALQCFPIYRYDRPGD